MNKTLSTPAVVSESDNTINVEETSDQANDRTEDCSISMSMVQNVLCIWLDKNIDNQNISCDHMVIQLRARINTTMIFIDPDECVDFLTNISDENVCMIISGTLFQELVPLIHSVAHLQSILIVCKEKTTQLEQWIGHWSKVRGVFTELTSIDEALQETAEDCELNTTPMSVIDNEGDVSKKKLNQLDQSFMYTQVIKEILFTITFEQKHKTEFFDHCRQQFDGNNKQLNYVKKLESNYSDKTPIWWYTCESFLYAMVNRALRTMDPDLIIKMGFFIVDLYRQIEQLHKQQFGSIDSATTLTLYRGQGLNPSDFENMMKFNGGLLSFNSFLSTSKLRKVSLAFMNRALRNPDLIGIVFVITVNPTQSTTPFASIINVGSYGHKEDEVLFSMHSVFRIGDITPINENRRLYYEVKLTITTETDDDLRRLTDHIREETFPKLSGWYRLSILLSEMGYHHKAEQVCSIILEQAILNGRKESSLYDRFGCIKFHLGEYDEAITHYERYLEILEKKLSTNHPALLVTYNNIGMIYSCKGDYQRALLFHEKTLAIRQQSLPPNHRHLADSHNNISNVYSQMGDFSKALSSLEKALEIREQSLPANHPDLASSYNNMGSVYLHMGDFPKAVSTYEKALAIQQQSLPPNHPNLAYTYGNIGNLYNHMGDYPKALLSCEKSISIQQQSLSPNHPDLASAYDNIGNVYSHTGDYTKALSSCEKALAIREHSLPADHPDVLASYDSIGLVSFEMGDYPKALSFYKKALMIRQQRLPLNHSDLASSYARIGNVYKCIGDYRRAFSCHEKAVIIQEQSLPPNHPSLATSYNNIGALYFCMSNYPKAVSSLEKALVIRQQSLPSNHPDLASSYGNISNVYKNMGDYQKALSFSKKAFAILQQSLPPDHPDIAAFYNNIGALYLDMSDYSQALSSLEKALEIRQHSLPPNHPLLASSHYALGLLYKHLNNSSKACSSFENALSIGQQALPVDHCTLQMYREALESIRK